MSSQIRQQEIDLQGWTILKQVMTSEECDKIKSMYNQSGLFRSRIQMNRHGFGSGEYQYFQYPLPKTIQKLRENFYHSLLPLANCWRNIWEQPLFPKEYAQFLSLCSETKQSRPTPLILKYKAGDYNRLHQDLYGEWVFPLQAAILLSEPHKDFCGGEFVLTEQKPRSQSSVSVVPLSKGDAVVFTVNQRPVKSQRGYFRVKMRHGVSQVRHGERYTLGLIMHDSS
ncbi:MAG: 2OG-Fe(II) oxygenase [Alteromonas stellipolaris]|uniref:2OG-Fe(II) oxygenase n=1 Tax=Alteromonas stellipolaris TaxID=233316 RepID=UPI003B8B3469